MDEKEFSNLFKKFVEDECTRYEADVLFDSIDSGDFDLLLQHEISKLPEEGSAMESIQPDKPLLNHTYLQLEKQIRKPDRSRWVGFSYLGKAAAVFIGVLLGGMAMYSIFKSTPVMSVTTDYAQTKQVVLPDGSILILNARSQARFGKYWDEDEDREVWLTGEGFFTVTHKENNQRFVVHSNDVDVEVLGTKFNVNNRRGKNQVVLTEGKVKLAVRDEAAGPHTINMVPGEMFEKDEKDSIRVQKVSTEFFTSWKSDELIFKDKELKEVVLFIEDNYGYKVTFSDQSLLTSEFTANIPSNKLNVLLEALSVSFNLKYKVVRDKEIIYYDSN